MPALLPQSDDRSLEPASVRGLAWTGVAQGLGFAGVSAIIEGGTVLEFAFRAVFFGSGMFAFGWWGRRRALRRQRRPADGSPGRDR